MVTSLNPVVFSGRHSRFRRIKSESRRPRRRVVSPLRPLPPLRSPVSFLVSSQRLCVSAVNSAVRKLPRSIKAAGGRLQGSVVTSLNPFVFSGRYSCFRRIKSESRRPRRRVVSPLRPLPPLRSPVSFLVSSQRLCVSAVNSAVRKLPRSIKADGGRRWSSVVTSLNPFVFSGRYSCFRRIKSESRRPRRRVVSPLRPLPPLRSPVSFLVSSQRLCVSAVNSAVRKLPRSIKADGGRRWSSVVNRLAREFQTRLPAPRAAVRRKTGA